MYYEQNTDWNEARLEAEADEALQAELFADRPAVEADELAQAA